MSLTNLNRRSFLISASVPLVAQTRAAAPRPNIVLVIADQLASWMVGCYGNQEIRTPNIDRIAAAGTRFANSFVCTPAGSPSRATLFTGRVPGQHGINDDLTPTPKTNPEQGQAAPPAAFAQEVMLFDVLSQAGYRCGYSGKWHLGEDPKPGHGLSYTYTLDGGGSPNKDPVMHLNGSRQQEQGYIADLITARGCEFLNQQSAATPFSLTVAYANPHSVSAGPPKKFLEMYQDSRFESFRVQPPAANSSREPEFVNDALGSMRKCAAAITALDAQIPVLQGKLLEKGFFENTIFIFTSDTGFLLGRHGLWGAGHASNPVNMYEESIKVPMIWQWPGRIPVHAARPEMISHYDFLPALCDAAGVKAPAGRNLCGRSYLPLVTNRPLPRKQPWQELVFGQLRYAHMVRDNYFKLVLRRDGAGPNELFDVRKDPLERVNLYEDPGFVTVRDKLAKVLSAWREKYSS